MPSSSASSPTACAKIQHQLRSSRPARRARSYSPAACGCRMRAQEMHQRRFVQGRPGLLPRRLVKRAAGRRGGGSAIGRAAAVSKCVAARPGAYAIIFSVLCASLLRAWITASREPSALPLRIPDLAAVLEFPRSNCTLSSRMNHFPPWPCACRYSEPTACSAVDVIRTITSPPKAQRVAERRKFDLPVSPAGPSPDIDVQASAASSREDLVRTWAVSVSVCRMRSKLCAGWPTDKHHAICAPLRDGSRRASCDHCLG